MTTGSGLLSELARDYEEALTREDQLASLHRAILGWTKVKDAELTWIGKKLREGEHLSFLSELSYAAPQPLERLQDELLEFALPLLEERGNCDSHLYEVLYCARVFATTFRYFGTLLEKANTCEPEQLKVIARLLDSEDKWGHRATVDNRICFQQLLRRRASEEPGLELQRVAALCAGPEAEPKVADPYLDWIKQLLKKMPKQLRLWWYPHYYGHGAALTGRVKGRLRLKDESLEWLMESMDHPRFRLFATYLLQRAVRLVVPKAYHAELRERYRQRRDSGPWCYFGERAGNWNRADWAQFLVRTTEEASLTSLFLEGSASWFGLSLIPRHRWCEETFGEVDSYAPLCKELGARGLVFYRHHQGQVQWTGMLGCPWIGPPLVIADFLGKDYVTTTTLSPLKKLEHAVGLSEKALQVCAVAHLKLKSDGSWGVFAHRPLRPDDLESPSGAFLDEDFESVQKWRDSKYYCE